MKNKLKRLSVIIAILMTISVSFVCASCDKTDTLVKKETTVYTDSTLRIEKTYKYDKDNRLTETVETDGEEGNRDTVKMIYSYVGDLLVAKENYHQKKDGSWDKSFYRIYGYNENGKLVSTIGYSVENNVKELFAMDLSEYNDKGQEVKVSSYMADGSNLMSSMAIEFEYNDKGQIVKEKSYMFDFDKEELVYSGCTTFEYNDNGTEKEIKYYTEEDELTTVERFTYDDKGNNTLFEVYATLEGGTESLCAKTVLEYDSKNRLTKELMYHIEDEMGELVFFCSTTYEY